MDMYGAVWYSSCSALQSKDFWYVLVKICAKAVATIAQDAKTTDGKEHIDAYIYMLTLIQIYILPSPTGFKLKSYIVAYPTPNVIGIKVNCTALDTDCLYAIYCTIRVKGMHTSFDNWVINKYKRKNNEYVSNEQIYLIKSN